MGVLRRIRIGERQRSNLRIGLRGLTFKKNFPAGQRIFVCPFRSNAQDLRLQHDARLVQLPYILHGNVGDDSTAARHDHKQPLTREAQHSLAHRGAADSQLCGKALFLKDLSRFALAGNNLTF